MTPEMSPYTPSLYRPDSYGRYRKYPHTVDTPIPGAGYKVGQLFWGEQELNLDGSRQPQPYGSYSQVPLRGLGQALNFQALRPQATSALVAALQARNATIPPPSSGGPQGGPTSSEATPEGYGFDVASAVADAAAAANAAAAQAGAQAAATEGESFFEQKFGPVPYWAIGLGVLAVAGGGGYLVYRSRKKKMAANRRRRRSRRTR